MHLATKLHSQAMTGPQLTCKHHAAHHARGAIHFQRPTAVTVTASRRAAAVQCAAQAAGGNQQQPPGGGFAPIARPAGAKKKQLAVAPPAPVDPSEVKNLKETPAAGPRGLLLVGLSAEDGCTIRRWFQTMEPDFVVSHCPAAALEGQATLAQALGLEPLGSDADAAAAAASAAGTPSPGAGGEWQAAQRLPEQGWEAAPAWVPPVVFFSGMAGEEVVGVLDLWRECTGLEPPAFAAVTEGTLAKPLRRLVNDIVRAQRPPSGGAGAAAAALEQMGGGGAGREASAGEAGEGTTGAEPEAEAGVGSRVKEFVMLGADGSPQTQPMDLDALRDQLRQRVEEKRRAAAGGTGAAAGGAKGGANKKVRRKQQQRVVDEEDRVRAALLESRKSGGGGKGRAPPRGFGSQ